MEWLADAGEGTTEACCYLSTVRPTDTTYTFGSRRADHIEPVHLYRSGDRSRPAHFFRLLKYVNDSSRNSTRRRLVDDANFLPCPRLQTLLVWYRVPYRHDPVLAVPPAAAESQIRPVRIG